MWKHQGNIGRGAQWRNGGTPAILGSFCCHALTPLAFFFNWILDYRTNCRFEGTRRGSVHLVVRIALNLNSVSMFCLSLSFLCFTSMLPRRSSYVVSVVASKCRQDAKVKERLNQCARGRCACCHVVLKELYEYAVCCTPTRDCIPLLPLTTAPSPSASSDFDFD